MTATAHAIVGGAIAASFNNPTLGIPLAIISHPILDRVPHWDAGCGWRQKTKYRLFTESVADLGLGMILTYLLFGSNVNPWYFWACVFASESWDVLTFPYLLFRWKVPPFSWAYKFQSKIQGKAALPWGIFTQLGTIALVIFLFNYLVK